MKRRAKALVVASTLLACLALGAGEALAAPPIVNVKAPSEIGFVSAKAEGEVNPGNVETSYRFDYVSQEKFEASQWAEASQAGSNGFPEGINTLTAVQPAFLEGLSAETTYHLRLVAENSGGTETDATTFTTEAASAPTLALDSPEGVSFTKAHIAGTVDPEGGNVDPHAGLLPIAWELQIARADEPGNWQFAEGGVISNQEPEGGGTPPAETTSPITVEKNLEGLSPATPYKFRLIASYAGKVATSPEEGEFETLAVTAPVLTTDDASAVTANSAHFSGTVDPGNADPAFDSSCTFEYITDAAFQPRNEEQELTVRATGGTYTLRFTAPGPGGAIETTAPIPFDASAASVQAALEALTSIGAGGVSLSGGPGDEKGTHPYAVTFTGPLAATNVETLVGDASALTGLNPGAGATPTQQGHFGFEGAKKIACDVNPVTGAGATPVKADATNLQPNTVYHLQLVAKNQAGTTALPAATTFTTTAVVPTIAADPSTPTGEGEVTIRGFVTPHNTTITDCHFDYGQSASYGQSAPCEPAPGGGGEPVRVSAHLSGLTPGATYHFRLSADNGVGPAVSGTDQTVIVPATPSEEECPNVGALGAGFLPDCRAYEMVSPPEKNGGDVMAETSRVRTAADGNAVAFASLSAFADAAGGGVGVDYIAARSTDAEPGDNGWATHAITPQQNPIPFSAITDFDPLYVGDLSADLSAGVFRAWSPVTEDSDVAGVANLYRRGDLLAAGAGSYDLLTKCPLCAEPGHEALPPLPEEAPGYLAPYYAGASADFQQLAFESKLDLTKDAPAQDPSCVEHPRTPAICQARLYEVDHGAVRLTGRIPAGSAISCDDAVGPACEPAQASIAGQGAGAQQGGRITKRPLHIVSEDGSRVFFTVPTYNGCCGNTFGLQGDGRLFARLGGTQTVQLNASERSDCAGDPTCGGDGEPDPMPDQFRPAAYWTASADGSRVFFTTTEALTDDAPVTQLTGDTRLYMYDTTKPPTDPHNLTYISADHETSETPNDVQGVIGASADGSYVYFFSTGQLVAGEPGLISRRGIFMWHDGELTFVGAVRADESGDLLPTGTNYILASLHARVTPDGRFLLSSHDGGGFAPGYEQGGSRELYLYSPQTGELTCASCRPSGELPKGDAMTTVRSGAGGSSAISWHLNRAVSDDGRYVFFTSADALLEADTNGKRDVYEYDNRTATLRLISSGTDKSDSFFLETSPDGSDVFFVTREQLSGWDHDSSLDLYDARVGGGFPEPVPGTAPCSGDSCRGGVSPTPRPSPVSSAAFSGPGNPPRKSCPKGRRSVKRQGKTRCVRAKHRKSHRHERATNNERRTNR